jgi:hypothetical protein
MYGTIETCPWFSIQRCWNMLVTISCVLFEHIIHFMFCFHSCFKFVVCFKYMFCYELSGTRWCQYFFFFFSTSIDGWVSITMVCWCLYHLTWSFHFTQWNLNMKLKLESNCMVFSDNAYGVYSMLCFYVDSSS